jgi:ferric-dicitrate binding protein FerR (iron transport regulator)
MNNPEELFEKLMNNKISRREFEDLLEGLDDNAVRAKYDHFLQEKFMEEMESHFGSEKEEEISKKEHQDNTTKEHKAFRGNKQFPIAAVILVFIGITFSIFFILNDTNNSDLQEINQTGTNELITKTTPNRGMFRMRLQDGSLVHLNAVSKISYPQEFTDEKREVEILGEAYFDIERDEARPFNIRVKDYSVKVLGTSFNIQAYEDEQDFSVTVESGTVKVISNSDGFEDIILKKNQKLVFSPETNSTKIEDINPEEELSWRKGILRFDSTPMAKVEKMLERWYGYDIIIEDEEIYENRLNGEHKNKNIKSVLESVTFATGTNYQIEDNAIIIKN